MEFLKINSNNGYLNLQDLPYNCIFNKVVTGCGGTTIVLRNEESYVIAVPTTELIVNKTGRKDAGAATIEYEDKKQSIFGLFGKFTYQVKKELIKYLATPGTKKIICTYDKLFRLDEFLNPSDFRLLVDEYHCLLKAYSYRDRAIDGVLDSFKKYKSYCFMSATPIQAEFKPACLENVKEIVADWNETDTLLVKLDKTNKPFLKAANYINTYKKDGFIELNGYKSYEAYFFINSVSDIAAILDHCQLADEEVRIICADNDRNRKTLEGYTISNSRSQNKRFNFITSKSFEGADYFSESGMCFVVSSTSCPYTLASIDTDIPQIAGRIRTKTNPFRNFIIHIFNTARSLNLDITLEEMQEKTRKEIEETEATVNYFNNAPLEVKNKLRNGLKNKLNDLYMSYDMKTDKFSVNDILPKLELYNHQVNQVIYRNGISLVKAYNDGGILTTPIDWEQLDETINRVNRKQSFKDAFIRYCKLLRKFVYSVEMEEIEKIHPLVVPAYHKLGEDKVRSLRYIKSSVEDALIALDKTKNLDSRTAAILVKKLPAGFHSNADIKRYIKEAFDTIGIKDSAKATLIDRWFEAEPSSTRIDGKKVAGYVIYRSKFLFNGQV